MSIDRLNTISVDAPVFSPRKSFTDMYKGAYDQAPIALKVIRCKDSLGRERIKKLLLQEMRKWSRLRTHENILLAVAAFSLEDLNDGSAPALLYPWQENGNISQYLRDHPRAPRLRLVVEIADALSFLHAEGFIHGNLHPENVLISLSGAAMVSDLNVASIEKELGSSDIDYNHIRYFPPEHLANDYTPTTVSDCFSFGSVAFEVLSRIQPFAGRLSSIDIVLALHDGEKPFVRPPNSALTPLQSDAELWQLMNTCWNAKPEARPTLLHVSANLQRIETRVRLTGIYDLQSIDQSTSKTLHSPPTSRL